MASKTINTEKLGTLSRTRLKKLVKENGGTQASLAKNLGTSPTTVRSWAWRLRNANK